MRAHVRNMAVVHHENEVGILHGRDALGDDDLRRLGDIGAEALADQRVGARVDRGGRVVEDRNLRLFESARAMQRRCFCPPETFEPPCSI